MIKKFEFVDSGRTFACCVEAPLQSRPELWWWFSVSTDDRHRYAPFEAAASDTQAGVRKRILAYYESLLAARARPAANPWRRPDPKLAAAAAAASLAASVAAGEPIASVEPAVSAT
jgi:hypothetical protein